MVALPERDIEDNGHFESGGGKKALKISTKNKHTHSWIEIDTSDDSAWPLCQALFGE